MGSKCPSQLSLTVFSFNSPNLKEEEEEEEEEGEGNQN